MGSTAMFIRNFNWRMLLMRIVVNMLALLFTVLVTPKVSFLSRSLLARPCCWRLPQR